MARYIDADRLINEISGNGGVFVYGAKAVAAIVSRINAQPTADVAEVKHGQWIAHYNGSFKPIYRCSVCNERLIGYSDPSKVPYCHCGVKMDGERRRCSNDNNTI